MMTLIMGVKPTILSVVCLKCKAKSNTYDPVLDISLDIRVSDVTFLPWYQRPCSDCKIISSCSQAY